MRISATTNADALGRQISSSIARQLPFATANALTATAHSIREAQRDEMRRVFDRPTPFTLNSLMVVPARKDSLVAEVKTKEVSTRNRFLERNVGGGFRRMTWTEHRIQEVTDHLLFGLVPADNARRDRYGNWSSGERNRVLSALQAQGDPYANETARSRRRARRTLRYFIPKPNDRGGLPPGIYRTQNGQLGIVAMFLRNAASYEPRFDFDGVAERTWAETYERHFDAALDRALATAR
jgi:hypothetical protein